MPQKASDSNSSGVPKLAGCKLVAGDSLLIITNTETAGEGGHYRRKQSGKMETDS